MPAILIFQKSGNLLSLKDITKGLEDLLGLGCSLMVNGKRLPSDEWENAGDGFQDGQVFVDLPDLETDEGQPMVVFSAAARLDRDESIQLMVDEIVEQEITLDADLNKNARDILLTFEDTPAGMEAGYAIAYAVASETGSGILFPGFTDDDDTVWFEDAEDFADAVFGEEDEGDDEDYDEGDEDGEDEEDGELEDEDEDKDK